MTKQTKNRVRACAVLTATVTIVYGAHASGASTGEEQRPPRSRVAIERALPKLDGAVLEATLVDVVHEPGGASPPHRHPCPVIGYVIEGAVRMQVEGQPERIYGPGESFFESPTDVHLVSANVSDREPARFLAFFVCDHKTPLTVPVTGGVPKRQ